MSSVTARKMVKVVFGIMSSSVASGSTTMATPAQVSSFLSVAKRHGIRELDTARIYNAGKSEELLSAVEALTDFAVSTNPPAFAPGSLSRR